MEENKKRLLHHLKRQGYIRSQSVLEAMEAVKRELFVPEELREFTYTDTPLPIGHGQTISAPHMVAMMCELLQIERGDRILEVGGGCGYHAAVLSRLTGENGKVVSVEIVSQLVKVAISNLEKANIENVEMLQADGGLGHPGKGPYQRITVAAASPVIPKPLLDQLDEGGIMVIPVGKGGYQNLMVLKKRDKRIFEKDHGGVVFVPLKGKYGY
ncbi:MAG TPA: protein-L-isoaspartate O-methyltransferase [Euryarchaeota archaeon]|nr:protein-L-isoaspartate O-methyltransferase [Euryarchaeota archaeon]